MFILTTISCWPTLAAWESPGLKPEYFHRLDYGCLWGETGPGACRGQSGKLEPKVDA
jgi:hypothetical protein